MRYLLSYIIISMIFACSDNKPKGIKHAKCDNATVWQGDMTITDTFKIEEGHCLVIEPGANITFEPGALILAFGNVYIEGTEAQPILMTANEPVGDHRILWGKSGMKVLKIKHTTINNGLITSYMTDNHFDQVTFTNKHKLKWNNAAARFWHGKILIENCTFNWNNQGEGLLLHKVDKPLIQNCTFYQVPDAIEYIHCKHGIIRNNSFHGCGDDAVDQNHCQFTLIENNEFYNIKDRALELGSEKFGRSDSLKVINNLFVGCKVAINVKESSNAYITNATFYNNDIALDVHTLQDSAISSKAVMVNSVISGSRMPVSANERAIAKVSNSMTDVIAKKALSIPVLPVTFKDPSKKDFRIVSTGFPSGLNAERIGYHKKGK